MILVFCSIRLRLRLHLHLLRKKSWLALQLAERKQEKDIGFEKNLGRCCCGSARHKIERFLLFGPKFER
jgi:hypothetical protein